MPVTINTLVLAKNDMYIYIHRDVYEQAVVLADRYPEFHTLRTEVGGSPLNEETAKWFYEQAPKPLHILAPYLCLVEGPVEPEFEVVCGVLHVITAMIHVRNFVVKPPEIRRSVSFSLSIREEYELAWDRFFATAIPYKERYGLLPQQPRSMQEPGDTHVEQHDAQALPATWSSVAELSGPTDWPPSSARAQETTGRLPVVSAESLAEAERTATRNLLK
uniref:Uncharacterized protein n=1 Tax=Paenibacillus athensensis TaxID=1967502 RepID=A0A4Y8Q7S9_9BACL